MDMQTCGITTIAIDWHPVASGFPDDDTTVLVALDDKEVYTAYRDAGNWRAIDSSPLPEECVTHWAHMPPAPGEEYSAPARTAAPVLLPLNEQTTIILGRADFACARTAQRLRELGHKIGRNNQEEQAAVIHLHVNMYQVHGAAWFQHANAYLDQGRPAAEFAQAKATA